ncbi:MAG: rod shape-determining protein MreC [Bacteroidales bacterium]
MRNLIHFFWKYNYFFLFLLLLALAVFLLVQKNYYHRNVYIQSSGMVTGKIYEAAQEISAYFNLNKQNQKLAEENARLRNATHYAFMSSSNNTIEYQDTLYYRYMEFLPARVISGPVSQRNNNWLINKGRDQGVEDGMGLISSDGVVGIVVEVSKHYSLVYSILHKQTQLSVMLQKNKHKGFLSWPGGNYKKGLLSDIPAHVKLEKGDTIISSGHSLMFPEGIMVGVISDFELRPGESFYDIEISFSEDYNNTDHVYIIKNLLKAEQNMLLEGHENDSG